MCNLSKGIEAKGVERGIAEGMAKGMARGMEKGLTKGKTDGILLSIRSLMETMDLIIEQAMTALKVPEAEREKYMDLVGRQ